MQKHETFPVTGRKVDSPGEKWIFQEKTSNDINNDHFEDIKLISNHALNLKEPYKVYLV